MKAGMEIDFDHILSEAKNGNSFPSLAAYVDYRRATGIAEEDLVLKLITACSRIGKNELTWAIIDYWAILIYHSDGDIPICIRQYFSDKRPPISTVLEAAQMYWVQFTQLALDESNRELARAKEGTKAFKDALTRHYACLICDSMANGSRYGHHLRNAEILKIKLPTCIMKELSRRSRVNTPAAVD